MGQLLPAHQRGTALGTNFDQAWRSELDIANGPFRFVSWSRGSQMVVQKNPAYWGKAALLNQIVFRFIPDTNTQFQAMRGGEVNIIHPQPQQQIADIKGQRGITVQQGSQFSWEHMDLQTGPGGHPALRKKFVREAIVSAVNRGQMRQVIYKDIAPNLPALNNTIYKNFQPEYEAHKFQPYGFSQKKAIQLLRSNGCTGGPATPSARNNDYYSCPGVGRLSFDFYSTAGNAQRELAFQIMQVQLRSVGIQLNSKFSLTALTVTLPTMKWDIMLFAWVGNSGAGFVRQHLAVRWFPELQRLLQPARLAPPAEEQRGVRREEARRSVQQGGRADRVARGDAAALRSADVPDPRRPPQGCAAEPDAVRPDVELRRLVVRTVRSSSIASPRLTMGRA